METKKLVSIPFSNCANYLILKQTYDQICKFYVTQTNETTGNKITVLIQVQEVNPAVCRSRPEIYLVSS